MLTELANEEDRIAYAWQSYRNVKAQHSVEHIHIARYERPQLAQFFEDRRVTDRPAIEMLWDDTAIKANDMFARGLWSMAHNSATAWFSYKDRDKKVNRDGEAQAWYAMVNEDLRDQFTSGGLYAALLMRLMDVGAFGFGALYSRPKRGTAGEIGWEWVPASECFYTCGDDGLCNSFIRPLNLTARQAIDERGWSRDKLDPTVLTAYANKDEATKFLFLHVVWVRNSRSMGRARSNRDFKFAGYYYQTANRKIIDEHGFRDMPYHVLGWGGASNVPYPTGIGYITLPEVRNINSLRKKFDRLLHMEADSPVLAPNIDEQPGGAQFLPSPGEYIWGGMSGDGKRMYEPYYTGNGSRSLANEIAASRAIIQEAWHYSLFMMLTQRQMTAAEVHSRDAKLIQAMGPFMVLMAADLESIVERQFYSRLEAGAYDPLPAIFDQNTRMQLKFSGVLAKAQQILEGEQIVQLAAEGQLIAQYAPEVVTMGTDWGEAWRKLADSKGLPDGIVLSREQFEQNLESHRQQQAAQQAAAMAPGMAKAAKDGADAMRTLTDASGAPGGGLAA